MGFQDFLRNAIQTKMIYRTWLPFNFWNSRNLDKGRCADHSQVHGGLNQEKSQKWCLGLGLIPVPFAVNNKKKNVPPVVQPYVFSVYLQNRLSCKKSIFIFLYQFLKSSQLQQEFFKSDDKFSWYWQKFQFSNKKLAIIKNPPFWRKLNFFFHIYKVKEYNLHTNKISTQKLSRNLFKSD